MDKDDQWGLKKTQTKVIDHSHLWTRCDSTATPQPTTTPSTHPRAGRPQAVSFTQSCLSHESLDIGPQHCKVSSSLISGAVPPQHTAAKTSYNCLLIISTKSWGQQGSAVALIPRAQIFQALNICLNSTKRGAGSKTTGYLKSTSPFIFPGCSHVTLFYLILK